HISEVSRSWVRDIGQHLDEGERTVAQVVEVEEDGTINLSLKRVNDNQKREAMDEWNREQKADKFLKKVSDRTGRDLDELYEEVAFPFQREYDSTFEGFEQAAMGEVDFNSLGIQEELVDAVTEVAKENISLKQVEMEGEMTIEVPGGEGVDALREALEVGENAEVSYISAPEYSITVWGRNSEDAKQRMDESLDAIEERVEEAGGSFGFEKK
ncbi:MAG: hypothetical protein ABEI07_00205, partial [Candidatus Nanohaloarchaea archaeon]